MRYYQLLSWVTISSSVLKRELLDIKVCLEVLGSTTAYAKQIV